MLIYIYISRCDSVGSFIDSQSPTSKPIASQGTMLLPFYEVFTNVRVSPFVSVSLFELLLIQKRSASGLFFPTSFLGLCAYWSLSGRIFILVNDGQYLLLGSWTLCLVHFWPGGPAVLKCIQGLMTFMCGHLEQMNVPQQHVELWGSCVRACLTVSRSFSPYQVLVGCHLRLP